MSSPERLEHESAQSCLTHWHGRSGRDYGLVREKLESFTLSSAALYVLAENTIISWVGTAEDLVADTSSRANFRLALENATEAFSLDSADNPQAIIWDLLGTKGPAQRRAA